MLREWQDQQRREQKEQVYARLRERYEITVERPGTPVATTRSDAVADAR